MLYMQEALLSITEYQRRVAQITLDAASNPRKRNRLGQFATPPQLALRAAKLALDSFASTNEAIRFLDPAFGTGSLYWALATSAGLGRIESAVGIEVDGPTAKAAQELWKYPPFNVRILQDDFTHLPPSSTHSPNLIICNPPYARHHHISPMEKATLQARVKAETGIEISRLAGLYCHFMLLSHKWLAENGVGVWIVPAEFMDVNYGEAIRRYLTSCVTLRRVHLFDPNDAQFEDALVTSSIVVFEKRQPVQEHEVEFTFGQEPSKESMSSIVPITSISKYDKWVRSTLTNGTRRAGLNHRTATIRFNELFEVKRGIATGANSFFILQWREAVRQDLPSIFLKPILPSPRYLTEPVIAGDERGFPKVEPQLFLLDCPLPIEDVQRDYPSLWDYLERGARAGINNRHLTKNRTPWYRQEQRKPATFLVTYMGRMVGGLLSLRFLWNQSTATATNTYHMIYPKPPLASYLAIHPQYAEELFRILAQISAEQLIDNGRTHGGGLHKVEPRELHRLVIPKSAFSPSIGAFLGL